MSSFRRSAKARPLHQFNMVQSFLFLLSLILFSFFSKKIFSCFYINKKELLGCYSATHKYRVHCGTFVGPCLLVRPIYAMFQPNKSMFRSVSFIISLHGCLSCSIFNLISFVIKYCTDNVIQIFHDFLTSCGICSIFIVHAIIYLVICEFLLS